MPEGHTLHRLAGTIRRHLDGAEVRSSSPQGRFSETAALLDGRVLTSAEAWGKHLLVGFDGIGGQVHVHLGLYGAFRFQKVGDDVPEAVGQVRWRLVGEGSVGDLRGPTACELMLPDEVDALLARLGPDPLRRRADPERAWRRISASRSPIAALVMDQSVVAGIGNVYRAELLFRHGVDPLTPGRELAHDVWLSMWEDLRSLMRVGVRTGRIETLRAEDDPGRRRPRERRSYVYRRAGEPCRVCGTTVLASVLSGRNLFWCPGCQAADTVRK
ncbi:Fpg/Nei family DNA glycosylase [Aeromicrobium sp. CF4.19]|uniref:Fpg/Nei family DNA glycosylase n=1 Tax=Aeromicrobium sp. CF4.19 TaxID=3373082 RepID=UPI003EE6F2F6